MSKNTKDELRYDIEFRLQMAGIDAVPVEAINSIVDLISNREKLARIDELYKMVLVKEGFSLETDKKFIELEARHIDTRLATLRKELDGGQE